MKTLSLKKMENVVGGNDDCFNTVGLSAFAGLLFGGPLGMALNGLWAYGVSSECANVQYTGGTPPPGWP
ncbi:hypothetical protein [uncultured Winogradskyella sp.]|uniref:hypothetical protein n=1 Tax=uncultured Winogradskyella sp. TaxID=395353 RepID=UPI0026220BE7|nr:hypothetical protein [uncultured Winogradskyella sp.]